MLLSVDLNHTGVYLRKSLNYQKEKKSTKSTQIICRNGQTPPTKEIILIDDSSNPAKWKALACIKKKKESITNISKPTLMPNIIKPD